MTELTRLLEYFYDEDIEMDDVIKYLNDKHSLLGYPIKINWDLFFKEVKENLKNMTPVPGAIADNYEHDYYVSKFNTSWGEEFILFIEQGCSWELNVILYYFHHQAIYYFSKGYEEVTHSGVLINEPIEFNYMIGRFITSLIESTSVYTEWNLTVRQFVSTINESNVFSINDSDEEFFRGVKQNYFDDEKYRKFDNNIVGDICTNENGIYITI